MNCKLKNCKKCDLHYNQKPLLDRLCESDVMWVGLSSKRVDDLDAAMPLSNDTLSGNLISEIESYMPDVLFYRTNLVKCVPLDTNGKLRYPLKIEMTACIGNLIYEINNVNPKVIFLLGKMTEAFVLKYFKEYDIQIDSMLIGIEHPSYICVYKKKHRQEYVYKVQALIKKYTGVIE